LPKDVKKFLKFVADRTNSRAYATVLRSAIRLRLVRVFVYYTGRAKKVTP